MFGTGHFEGTGRDQDEARLLDTAHLNSIWRHDRARVFRTGYRGSFELRRRASVTWLSVANCLGQQPHRFDIGEVIRQPIDQASSPGPPIPLSPAVRQIIETVTSQLTHNSRLKPTTLTAAYPCTLIHQID